jgi:tetratricopeptide (TPR) repeat protein
MSARCAAISRERKARTSRSRSATATLPAVVEGPGSPERGTREGGRPADGGAAAGAESGVAIVGVNLADDQYDAAVADLERALKQGRGKLDKATIAVVEQNLQTIDQAIAQAREALASDPANSYLSGHLVEARRRKLDLLRRATALTDMD